METAVFSGAALWLVELAPPEPLGTDESPLVLLA
jgi:hypothetical protein